MSSFEFKNDNVKITSLPGSPAQDGTDATGVNQPIGGIGIRGWLSGIYNLLFSGSAKVQLTGSTIGEEFIFQNAVTVAGEGEHLTLSGQDKVIVTIPTGTSTSRTIVFKATSSEVVAYMLGSKVESSGSITLAVSTTGQSEVWEITGLSGYDDFFCEITAIAGGNVTVKGRLVA